MIVRLTVWMIFLTVPIWLFGGQSCKASAWWNDEDKIKKYIEITSPKLAGLLIPKYSGYSTYIRTNIPALYNQYIVNKYPT